jgi:hypothetical protein
MLCISYFLFYTRTLASKTLGLVSLIMFLMTLRKVKQGNAFYSLVKPTFLFSSKLIIIIIYIYFLLYSR